LRWSGRVDWFGDKPKQWEGRIAWRKEGRKEGIGVGGKGLMFQFRGSHLAQYFLNQTRWTMVGGGADAEGADAWINKKVVDDEVGKISRFSTVRGNRSAGASGGMDVCSQ